MALLDAIQNVISALRTLVTPTKVELTVVRRLFDPASTDLVFTDHELLAEYELPEKHPYVDYAAGQDTEIEAYVYNPDHDPEVSPYRLAVQDCNTTLSIAATTDEAAMKTVLDHIPNDTVRKQIRQAVYGSPGASTTLSVNLKVVRALRGLVMEDVRRTARSTPGESSTATIV